MKLPILFNPTSGTAPKDPDTLLRPLPLDLRERVEAIPFGPPWDFGPHIAQAVKAGGPLFVWGGDGTIHYAAKALIERGCPGPLAAIPGGSGNGLVRGCARPWNRRGPFITCWMVGSCAWTWRSFNWHGSQRRWKPARWKPPSAASGVRIQAATAAPVI